MNRTPENGMDAHNAGTIRILIVPQPLLDQLFASSGAALWELSREVFAETVEYSATKHFAGHAPSPTKLEEYLSSLHLQDLALACACAEGRAAAWDYFVSTYRSYLRSAAAAILHCPPDSPASCELADSLFADLYGLAEGANRRSLFRYFHGRSSLKTWLRAVLAQRHVDAIRANRRFTEIESVDGHPKSLASTLITQPRSSGDGIGLLQDPHRADLLALFRQALEVALALLDVRDKERLRLYYAAEHTLAEIGRELGEHESSVSRNLERTRGELRHQVELALRKGGSIVYGPTTASGLSDEQIALCFEYAAQDAPIDIDKLLPQSQPPQPKRASKKP
jgi:RNA polymerase sigma-70 factor